MFGRALLLLGALLLGACASAPRQPWYLTTDGLPEYRASTFDDISTYPHALATTVEIIERDLGLPRPQVRLIFLPDARTLQELLIEIGYSPELARGATRQLVALGGYRHVLINQARFELRDWPRRLATMAHELAHVLQYELGGGVRGASAQWLREGFAEWLETRVLAALGQADGAKAQQQAVVRVRTHARRRMPLVGPTNPYRSWFDQARPPASLPQLSALGSFPQWVEQSSGQAGPILYDYSFIAVTLLVEQHGVPSVVRYFELFAARQEHAANFLEAFGESEKEFEDRLRETVTR